MRTSTSTTPKIAHAAQIHFRDDDEGAGVTGGGGVSY